MGVSGCVAFHIYQLFLLLALSALIVLLAVALVLRVLCPLFLLPHSSFTLPGVYLKQHARIDINHSETFLSFI